MPRPVKPAIPAKKKQPPKTKAERLAKVEAAGVSPLDVMVWNMRFYHDLAVKMTQAWQDEPVQRHFDDMLSMRSRAQTAACDVAPYLHPRLSAAQVKTTAKVIVEVKTIPPFAQRASA